ncbi:MAG: hypothetical protein ABI867_34985, partial [Kofleriaceae bacterium]
MTRILLAVVALAAFAGSAHAGLRCRRVPRIVFWNEAADVHEDGQWHRTKPGKPEADGHLAPPEMKVFRTYASASTDPKRTIACLDALIANAVTATKTCTP